MDRKIQAILKKVSKPGRYIGGEIGEILKDKKDIACRWAFCFPDTYEIGMSNLGLPILYECLNAQPDVWCERCYAPWPDMAEEMKKAGIGLWALESGDRLTDFDVVAFTLQYEQCYTNVLYMLKLAGIPLYTHERGEDCPILIGGGPATYNAEPVAPFFDIFSIGEGEEALPEFARLYIDMKKSDGYTKERFLHEAAKLPGFYVPSLYEFSYNEDGTVKEILPKYDDIPKKIVKRIIKDLDAVRYPTRPVIPYIETVHSRIMVETFRGCMRGCRFCQACNIYRPVREKKAETLDRLARELYKNTGYDEISLTSLSISDYTELPELTDRLLSWTDDEKISLSLPSQRVDAFTKELMEKISSVRKSGLTFAPEAGTQRLRDAINKCVSEEDLMRACGVAFDYGKNTVKLYFMSGLPTETDEDIVGIARLAEKVVETYYKNPNRPKMAPNVTISVSCFIPKPFTAFQWEKQDTMAELERKQALLKESIRSKHVRYTWHDARMSFVEAVLAKGDRRLAKVLERASELGAKFDAWDEYFDYEIYMRAFADCGVDPAFYANREIGEDEILPWDLIDCGVSRAYLLRERHKAYRSEPTGCCKDGCAGCGANSLGGDTVWCPKTPGACPRG